MCNENLLAIVISPYAPQCISHIASIVLCSIYNISLPLTCAIKQRFLWNPRMLQCNTRTCYSYPTCTHYALQYTRMTRLHTLFTPSAFLDYFPVHFLYSCICSFNFGIAVYVLPVLPVIDRVGILLPPARTSCAGYHSPTPPCRLYPYTFHPLSQVKIVYNCLCSCARMGTFACSNVAPALAVCTCRPCTTCPTHTDSGLRTAPLC